MATATATARLATTVKAAQRASRSFRHHSVPARDASSSLATNGARLLRPRHHSGASVLLAWRSSSGTSSVPLARSLPCRRRDEVMRMRCVGSSMRSSVAVRAGRAVDDVGAGTGAGGSYEAIVVVAGGIENDGSLPAWVRSRLDFAVEEYNRHAAASAPTYVVLSGSATPHKPPPLAKGGFILHESTAMAQYLMDRGVPAERILKDTASMDTIGNAYMTLCMHAIPRNWRRVLVVTSSFHMGRTKAAFEWVWGLYAPGPDGAGRVLGEENGQAQPYIHMDFATTADSGLTPAVVAARAEREAKSEAALRENQERVTNLSDFAEWLYTTHLCYAVTRQHEIGEFAEMKSDPALKSY